MARLAIKYLNWICCQLKFHLFYTPERQKFTWHLGSLDKFGIPHLGMTSGNLKINPSGEANYQKIILRIMCQISFDFDSFLTNWRSYLLTWMPFGPITPPPPKIHKKYKFIFHNISSKHHYSSQTDHMPINIERISIFNKLINLESFGLILIKFIWTSNVFWVEIRRSFWHSLFMQNWHLGLSE